MTVAAGALFMTDVKNFIEACMKSIGFKNSCNLINERKNNLMHIRMIRTVALTIQAILIRPFIFFGKFNVRSLIKFRINLKQFSGGSVPRLMAQQIDLGQQPDVVFTADSYKF